MSENKAQALGLLLEVLMKIETKLDSLLEGCQNEALQQMRVMQRYLGSTSIIDCYCQHT